jgi:hypothetical protein
LTDSGADLPVGDRAALDELAGMPLSDVQPLAQLIEGSKDAARCVRYLTKYLTKQPGPTDCRDCGWPARLCMSATVSSSMATMSAGSDS